MAFIQKQVLLKEKLVNVAEARACSDFSWQRKRSVRVVWNTVVWNTVSVVSRSSGTLCVSPETPQRQKESESE